MDEEDTSPDGLETVGSYDSPAAAAEHGLVVVAMRMDCWLLSPSAENPNFQLAVRPADAARAHAEIAAYQQEEIDLEQSPIRELPSFSFGRWFAFFYALILVLCFIQQTRDLQFEQSLISDSRAIIEDGKTYLAVSALFLHGDTFHLGSNIFFGIIFGILVANALGPKTGWALILLSGSLGNLINAWHYYPVPHFSLGASTAVFGALGLLAGYGLIAAFLSPKSAPWARAILPIAGGLALLGWLGLGGSDPRQVDVMAHIFGFAVGIPLGFAAGAIRILWGSRQIKM